MSEQGNQAQSSNQVIADEIDAYLQACIVNRYFIGSVLVVRAGEVLLSAGYDMANLEHDVPHTPQSECRDREIIERSLKWINEAYALNRGSAVEVLAINNRNLIQSSSCPKLGIPETQLIATYPPCCF
ncbi:MAG: hypothetical protein JOZ78_08145 [Chroococcidiopsidaceae cyanobacterium CP_BM_ER_R8_30]|nr:hypothetical protein [Chroococcidiopsidaceae cyanobacterium CP_BM_ER_R8_30]